MRRWLLPLPVLVLALALAPVAHAAVARPAPRILGGGDAGASSHPSMAALVVRDVGMTMPTGQSCGGTVIAPIRGADRRALHHRQQPAGHADARRRLVVVTGKDEPRPPRRASTSRSAQIVTDPAFDPGAFDDDVAVVLLATPTSATRGAAGD